jgi:hypothetical protein
MGGIGISLLRGINKISEAISLRENSPLSKEVGNLIIWSFDLSFWVLLQDIKAIRVNKAGSKCMVFILYELSLVNRQTDFISHLYRGSFHHKGFFK